MRKQSMKSLKRRKAPKGYDPLEAQRALQRRIIERFPDRPLLAEQAPTVGEMVEVVFLNTQAATIELCEMVDHLPFKWWKDHGDSLEMSLTAYDKKTGAITEAKYELVDALHFLINCAIAMGMSWDDIIDVFYTKQTENHNRQERGY